MDKTLQAAIVSALLLMAQGIVLPETAMAQQAATQTYQIPAGDLDSTLRQFAAQNKLQLVYPAELVEGKRSAGLSGTYTQDEALRRLLQGSGLQPQPINAKTIGLKRSNDAPAQKPPRTAPQSSEVVKPKEEVTELETILVTGTNIRGVENQTLPALVFTRDDIERTGYSTPQDFFRSIPQNFSGGGVTEDGTFGGGTNSNRNFTAATSLNLRGLGNSSTLFLVNGRRLAPTVFGAAVDISLIPLSAVDRIEIVTDGSSAVYGSDAVAGVVNVLTKRDFEGVETRLRYGTVTEGGRQERTLSSSVGHSWSSGNALATLQYQEQDPLEAKDRDSAGRTQGASQLLPGTDNLSLLTSLRQNITPDLEFSADALLSRRDVARLSINSLGNRADTNADADSTNLSTTLTYWPSDAWSLSIGGQYSQQKSRQSQVIRRASGVVQPATTDQDYIVRTANLLISGELLDLPGGSIGLAVGGEYRQERQESEQTSFGAVFSTAQNDRDVQAVFGELYVPLVGEANRFTLVNALDLSGSVRYDHYSDFGSTTNYRVGIRWSPIPDLNLRSSYSTSFRAPNTLEIEGASSAPGLFVTNFTSPSGVGLVPGFQYFGGGKPLGPEKARSWTVGFDYTLPGTPRLRLGANYYDITFRDRITSPPFTSAPFQQLDVFGPLITPISSDADAQALIDDVLSQGGLYIDFLGTGPAGVRFAYDARQLNASVVNQDGFDVWIDYAQATSFGKFDLRASAAKILHIDNKLTETASSADLVDTFGNPAGFRMRLDAGLSKDALFLNASLNYTDSYTNTLSLTPQKISSWTTIDVLARLDAGQLSSARFWHDASLTLSVQNLFDVDPPFVDTTTSLIDVAYDSANASPLGRFVAIEFRKQW